MEKIIIIGGGPAGISAAISIRRHHPQNEIILIEQNPRLGKKLLITGNGKCNISNSNIAIHGEYYNQHISAALAADFTYIINTLEEWGISLSSDNKLLYPTSDTATTVLEILRNQLALNRIRLLLDTKVIAITKPSNFKIALSNKEFLEGDKVIIACGGQSAPDLGSDGTIFPILNKLGHKVTQLLPGLTPFFVDKNAISGLSGLRAKVEVELVIEDKIIAKENGEVLFKLGTISGIVINNLSSYYQHYVRQKGQIKGKAKINLSFYPLNEIRSKLEKRNNLRLLKKDILLGLFPKMLTLLFYKKCQINHLEEIEQLTQNEIDNLSKLIAQYPIPITGTEGFKKSQVTIGGIDLMEVDFETFQSKIINNLYIIGETLDVDGPCGGYNLHFAFYSGIMVGKNLY